MAAGLWRSHYQCHEINHMTEGTEGLRQCGELGVLCTFNDLSEGNQQRGSKIMTVQLKICSILTLETYLEKTMSPSGLFNSCSGPLDHTI